MFAKNKNRLHKTVQLTSVDLTLIQSSHLSHHLYSTFLNYPNIGLYSSCPFQYRILSVIKCCVYCHASLLHLEHFHSLFFFYPLQHRYIFLEYSHRFFWVAVDIYSRYVFAFSACGASDITFLQGLPQCLVNCLGILSNLRMKDRFYCKGSDPGSTGPAVLNLPETASPNFGVDL